MKPVPTVSESSALTPPQEPFQLPTLPDETLQMTSLDSSRVAKELANKIELGFFKEQKRLIIKLPNAYRGK